MSHVIGSDVHFGESTLEPLSSVVAAIKLEHPTVKVLLFTKERAVDSMEQLKHRIEEKAGSGFSVLLRDVLHDKVTTVKMLEC